MENNIETGSMNRDILAGKWMQMRGELKAWWGKLSDDDVDWIAGEKDKLIGLLQERYGYAREQAEQEFERRLEEYGDNPLRAVASMSAKAGELGSTAARKANAAAPIIGAKMKSLSNAIRAKAPRLATSAVQVADGLESASNYRQEKKLEHLREDFRRLVRRYPVRSLLIGLGLGFLLAGRNRK